MYILKILNISFVNFLASYSLAGIKKSKITYYMYYTCIINILIKFIDIVIIGSRENFYTSHFNKSIFVKGSWISQNKFITEYYLSLELF